MPDTPINDSGAPNPENSSSPPDPGLGLHLNASVLKDREWYGAIAWLGTVWGFLLFLALDCFIVFGSYSGEMYFVGTVAFLGIGVALHLGGLVNIKDAIVKRPWRTLMLVGLYIAIGFVWIVCYWVIDSRKAARIAMDDKRAWLVSQGIEGTTTVPENLKEQWIAYATSRPDIYKIPRWYDHKGDLAGRGILWPISVLHTFLADFVYEVYVWVIESFGNTLDRISEWMFSDVFQGEGPPVFKPQEFQDLR